MEEVGTSYNGSISFAPALGTKSSPRGIDGRIRID
jgi:hypothetical protein